MNAAAFGVRTYEDGLAWKQVTQPLLTAAPLDNLLMLGITEGMGHDPKGVWLATIHQGEDLVGAALCSPDYKILLSPMSAAAAVALAGRAAEDFERLPGVQGRPEAAEAFADAWRSEREIDLRPGRKQRVHVLETLVPPAPGAPGHARLATDEDLELVHGWYQGFMDDIGEAGPRLGPEYMAGFIDRRSLMLWVDEQRPVSMAARVRDMEVAAAVSLVYTPPELRRRGYASQATAAVTRMILDSGRPRACLYTDLANPTSNHIYAELGYVGHHDEFEIWFQQP